MATVQGLITYLSAIKDKDQTVFYQYLLAEDTSYSPELFEQLVEATEESSADNLTNYMLGELEDAENYLESEEED